MSAFLDDARDEFANAVLAVLQELGEQLTFQNKGEEASTLWGSPQALSRSIGTVAHSTAEESETVFEIPRQDNFPPDNDIAIGASITYQTFKYWVQSWESDSLGAVYALKCKRVQTARVGGK